MNDDPLTRAAQQDRSPTVKRPTTVKRAVGRPIDGDSELTRQQLVNAAMARFAALGLARVTLRDISDSAGVTPGTLYHHFSSKTELYLAAYVEAVEGVYARFGAATANVQTATEMIDIVLGIHLGADPALVQMSSMILRAWVEHADADTPPLPVPATVRSFLARLARTGVEAGELDPADADTIVEVFRCLAWGIFALQLTGREHAAGAVRGLRALLVGDLLAPKASPPAAKKSGKRRPTSPGGAPASTSRGLRRPPPDPG